MTSSHFIENKRQKRGVKNYRWANEIPSTVKFHYFEKKNDDKCIML